MYSYLTNNYSAMLDIDESNSSDNNAVSQMSFDSSLNCNKNSSDSVDTSNAMDINSIIEETILNELDDLDISLIDFEGNEDSNIENIFDEQTVKAMDTAEDIISDDTMGYSFSRNTIDEVEEVILNDLAESVLLNDLDISSIDFPENITDSLVNDQTTAEELCELSTLHKITSVEIGAIIKNNNEAIISLKQADIILSAKQHTIDTREDKNTSEEDCIITPAIGSDTHILSKKNITQEIVDEKYHSSNEKDSTSQNCIEHMIPKELILAQDTYINTDVYSSKLTMSIYENAIKRIDIDKEKLFRRAVLEEFKNEIELNHFDRSRIYVSRTYSKIRNYIINKLSQKINDILNEEDITIIPGTSISDIHSKCISNRIFFYKLGKYCNEIAKCIEKINSEEFSSMIQNYISFISENSLKNIIYKIIPDKKNKLSPLLKVLIINSIINLPQKIKYVIKKLDSSDVSMGMFVQLHGTYIPRSFLRKAINAYKSYKLMTENRSIDTDDEYIKMELEKLLHNTTILHEGMILSPSKSVITSMVSHLLEDMSSIFFDERHKELTESEISQASTSRGVKRRYTEDEANINQDKYSKKSCDTLSTIEPVTLVFEQLPSTKNTATKTKISENYVSPSDQEGSLQNYIEHTLPEELKLVSEKYKYLNIFSVEPNTSVYEHAIKKINIDEENLLKSGILKEFEYTIETRNFDESFIDISLTYSNIRKYIADKISPYINYIIRIKDIVITPGMSVSDIHSAYISNHAFFDKLSECCKEIEKDIDKFQHGDLLYMIQSIVNFGSSGYFYTNVDKGNNNRKNRLTKLVKKLIIKSIRNLPRNIKSAIEKFEKDDILRYMFVPVHDVYFTKLFMRNILDIYIIDKLMMEDKYLKIDSALIKVIKSKLEIELNKSVIIYEGKSFLPNKNTVKSVVDYLLLDMIKDHCSIYSKLFTENDDLRTSYITSSNGGEYLDLASHLTIEKSIYESAIEKIIIDENKEFINFMLEKFGKKIIDGDFNKLFTDIYVIYSNVRKYIANKFSSYINRIIRIVDVFIVPGMYISNIKTKCISNATFFQKLHEHCKEIVRDINEITHEDLLTIFNSSNILGVNINNIDCDEKKEILQSLKHLITKTASNLPQMIIFAIDRSSSADISKWLFTSFHGAYVTKSFIRNVMDIYNGIDKEKMKNKSLKISDHLLEKTKLELLVKKSVILVGEKVFLPNKSTIEFILDHLLSDMIRMSCTVDS